MIRVLLVDDQELVRAGLRGILLEHFGFNVVGECGDGSQVGAAVDALAPDIVLMDVRMPVVDGVQATRQLRQRRDGPPVLALIGQGRTNTEIAQQLAVSEGTVKTHINHLFAKIDLRDRAAAIVFAFDHDLVAPHPTERP